MALIRPTLDTDHSKHFIFLPEALNKVIHAFVKVDTVQPPLQPKSESSLPALERQDKVYKVKVNKITS